MHRKQNLRCFWNIKKTCLLVSFKNLVLQTASSSLQCYVGNQKMGKIWKDYQYLLICLRWDETNK